MATENIEVVEEIVQSRPDLTGSILFLGGIAVGVGAGYFFARRRLEAKYKQMADDEIQLIRDIYFEKTQKLERIQPQKPSLEEMVEKHKYAPPTEGDQKYTDAEQAAIDEVAGMEAAEVPEPEVRNIFHAGEIEGWDWDVEKEIRAESNGEVPYVLHRDEYFNNEKGWEQISLTYFEGDDTLADDHDTPVDDQDAMVGLGNLAKFGHGSNDPAIVYVRNEELQLEIEILHSDGKFSEQRRGIPVDPPRDESGKFAPKRQEGDPRKRRSRGTE